MTEPNTTVSRRHIVTAGTGIVATGLLSAIGSNARASEPDQRFQNLQSTAPPMQNPLAQYVKPPFPAQHQPAPGIQAKMQPVPDCGETSYRGSGKLAGRKALVTGGDSGIGRAAAIAFAREGADVAINYLPVEQPDADDVVRYIQAAGRKAVTLPGDITDESFCQKLVNDAANQLGGLDILVSNAGKQVYQKSLLDISTQQFDETFRTNVYGMFWIVRAALGHMKAGSSIICTTSINAFDPSPGILDYAMTKGAIKVFVQGLAKQLVEQGIRVNGVAPGPVWTPLQVSGGQSMEKLVSFGSQSPMKRPGEPAELAATYVLLASQQSSFTTGAIYGITGGMLLA